MQYLMIRGEGVFIANKMRILPSLSRCLIDEAIRKTSHLLVICGLASLVLSLGHIASASEPSFGRLSIQDCAPEVKSQLLALYTSLPNQVKGAGHAPLSVRCVARALDFGFEFSAAAGQASLLLGGVSRINERRATYRLDHLTTIERQRLWHGRGLVHALLRLRVDSEQWHRKI